MVRRAAPLALALALAPLLVPAGALADDRGAARHQPRPPAAKAPAAAPNNDWARGAVFYEIFVRSFADSNGDGKGDLPGLIAKLDYLRDGNPRSKTDLGVDAIWLMPIFKSPSYHGYDTSDYETVARDYGTNEDFVRLCQEAHRRGLRVIIDLVLNHTSAQHPWFLMSSSRNPRQYKDWYVWRTDDPGWTRTWDTVPAWHGLPDQPGRYYYGLFWEEMPDLNYRNQAVRDEAKYVARLWLERGADGFRLDAVRHLIETGPGPFGQEDTDETHLFLKEFAAAVRAIRPEAVLVGEAWTQDPEQFVRYFGDATAVRNGDEIPVLFDFALASALLDGLKSGRAAPIAGRLEGIVATYPKGAIDAPFLTNHDSIRVATELQGDLPRLRSAAAILLTLPGAPFIYYGEEIGLRQPSNGDDEFKRTPMHWSAAPGAGFTTGRPWQRLLKDWETVNVAVESVDPASLLARYRQLIRLRHASEALRLGDLRPLPSDGSVLAFLRESEHETVLVVHNLGAAPASTGPLALERGPGHGHGQPAPLLVDPGVTLTRIPGGLTATLAPNASGVWTLGRR